MLTLSKLASGEEWEIFQEDSAGMEQQNINSRRMGLLCWVPLTQGLKILLRLFAGALLVSVFRYIFFPQHVTKTTDVQYFSPVVDGMGSFMFANVILETKTDPLAANILLWDKSCVFASELIGTISST